jgi:hypothetical protein
MRPYRIVVGCSLSVALVLGGTACSEALLPAPINLNVVDTVSLFAIDGTPVTSQSGYSVVNGTPVRTDVTSSFDFLFNIDTLGRAVLIPASALHLVGNAGIQPLPATTVFAELRTAPGGFYITDTAVAVLPGDVLAVRSRLVSCDPLGNLYYYAKVGIIAIDAGARRISFEILSNRNCGYRSLEPGKPTE